MSSKLEIEQQIIKIAEDTISLLRAQGEQFPDDIPAIQTEIPRDEKYGHISLNIAMQLAKTMGKNPREIAEMIIQKMDLSDTYVIKTEIAGPGFINFTLNNTRLFDELEVILDKTSNYGKTVLDKPASINIEFVSANPTGPLHIGNARGGAIGDTLANIYHWAGWNVSKEFYLNDAGNQIIKFGESLAARYLQIFDPEIPFPEKGYLGDDIIDLAERYYKEFGDLLLNVSEDERTKTLIGYGLQINISNMKRDLERYRIIYDTWFHESSLHKSGMIDDIIQVLSDNGDTYEADGALWFCATNHDCEKDEVLIRANGVPTYFAADIAYHYNKLKTRNFDMAVNVWGADHHGHVHRLQMALKAAGIAPERLKVVLMQLVSLMKDGEPVRISKRSGKSITLSDLLDEVSVDAARYIFNTNNATTHLNFDMDLAIEQSNENPVFYVQYAHARIQSILRSVKSDTKSFNLNLLTEKTELALIDKMTDFSKEIHLAARDYDPSRMTRYAYDLATCFHSFYNACRVNCDEVEVKEARLKLISACGFVLKSTLSILAVDAPDRM